MKKLNDLFLLTEEEIDLLPNEEDVLFYKEHGFYTSKKLLSDDEIDQLLEASDEFYKGKKDHEIPIVPKGATYWRPGDKDNLRQNCYITRESEVFRKILTKPIIGAVAAKLACSEESRLFVDVLRYKSTKVSEGTTIGWHIDRHYWQMFTSDEMLTAFIPLHDCFEEHGTIIMIDGSNKWTEEANPDDSTTLHFADRDVSDLEKRLYAEAAANGANVKKVPINLKKGQINFHNSMTYHGSLPNTSGRPRQSVSLHIQDKKNNYRRHYLDNGNVAAHHTEQLCSRNEDGTPNYKDLDYFPLLWREKNQFSDI
ncbi:Phytanoyl-CoA dioxygenase (PhyH) [Marinomonas spartinae]|uniref:phytanoyl-CoA dioxygenase family protein n=1 Tax=Marinomonas spartinae TaxID=1792290 RepID=UPI000809068F|nr:phytanoyl-CoA dioxygenase family protein [Marinomonas spartinae]SBS31612.1 Phytanoyl-CoA dioxygenase (PhyH) [Marinomonas spartinae]